jgi:cyclic pyranopterin phosphate synthase
MLLHDQHGRRITDLRISVTDRCNYRCVYCRTGTGGAQYPDLPIADYLRMARLFVSQGIEKVRLTGGEPLLRAGLLDLVRELAAMKTVDGKPLDIAITTNGHLLEDMAQPLKDAGLTRITVSMDAVNASEFAKITRVAGSYERVLAGVRAANRAGLHPVKVNCVLLRGFNDDQVLPFARFARDEGVAVRFIEFMPLEEDRVWTPEIVVRLDEILATIRQEFEVTTLEHAGAETARRYTLRPLGAQDSGLGPVAEIGIIAPVSHPFCGHCSRVRVTSDGKIRTCLFSQIDHDLYGRMRAGESDAELAEYIHSVISQKEARHHIGEPGFLPPSRTMVHIGG